MRSTTTASRPSPSLPGLPPPLSTFLPRPTPIQLSTFRLPSPLRPCLPAPIRSVRVVRLTNHPGPATGRPERTATPRLLAPAGGRMNGPARRSTWAAGLPSVGMADSAGPEPRPGRPGNGAPPFGYGPHTPRPTESRAVPSHGDRITATESRRRNHGDGVTATESRRRARWSGRGSEHVSRPSRPTRPWLPAFKPQSPAHLPARPAPPAGPAPPAITIQSGAGRPQATGCL